MITFPIYYSDLQEEARFRLCERFKTTPEEENWQGDFAPLAIMERDDEDISEEE